MSEMQTIEIHGTKIITDTRTAERSDVLRVGSKVKILCKGSYSGPDVYPGVVVGFEPFKELPTIIVCYLQHNYSEAELKFAYVNEKSHEKYDLILSIDDELPIAKTDMLARMDTAIEKAQASVDDLKRKRDYFLKHFNQYFEQADA